MDPAIALRLIEAIEENTATNRALLEVLGESPAEASKRIRAAKREARERKGDMDRKRAAFEERCRARGIDPEAHLEKIRQDEAKRLERRASGVNLGGRPRKRSLAEIAVGAPGTAVSVR